MAYMSSAMIILFVAVAIFLSAQFLPTLTNTQGAIQAGTVANGQISVKIVAPTSVVTLSGIVPVELQVTDQAQISHVDLYVDSYFVNSFYSAPYVWNWDTSNFSNGFHRLTANAHGTNGASVTTYASIYVGN